MTVSSRGSVVRRFRLGYTENPSERLYRGGRCRFVIGALVTAGAGHWPRACFNVRRQILARMALPIAPIKWRAQQTLRSVAGQSGRICVGSRDRLTDGRGRCRSLIKPLFECGFGRLDVIVNNVGDFRWGTLADRRQTGQNILAQRGSSNLSHSVCVLMCRPRWPAHSEGPRGGRIINLGAVVA